MAAARASNGDDEGVVGAAGARGTTIELAVQGHAALLKALLARLAAEERKGGAGEPESVREEMEGWKGMYGVRGLVLSDGCVWDFGGG